MKKLFWLTDLHLVEPGDDWPQDIDPLAREGAVAPRISSVVICTAMFAGCGRDTRSRLSRARMCNSTWT